MSLCLTPKETEEIVMETGTEQIVIRTYHRHGKQKVAIDAPPSVRIRRRKIEDFAEDVGGESGEAA